MPRRGTPRICRISSRRVGDLSAGNSKGVDVSCYHLSRLLFDLKMNESIYQRSLQDFEKVMSDYDLTAEEKDALRAGDPRKLRQLARIAGAQRVFLFGREIIVAHHLFKILQRSLINRLVHF